MSSLKTKKDYFFRDICHYSIKEKSHKGKETFKYTKFNNPLWQKILNKLIGK